MRTPAPIRTTFRNDRCVISGHASQSAPDSNAVRSVTPATTSESKPQKAAPAATTRATVTAASMGRTLGGIADTVPPPPTLPGLMPIDIDIAHVARLARLALGDDDLEQYRRQLGVILDHAAKVQSLDTTSVKPTAHPLGFVNAFRPDEVSPSLDRDEVLSQAPAARDGYFVVPPALEGS